MSEITKAIQSLCDEKNLSYEAVMETIETALAAAYRKDFGNKQQNIKVKFDPETGDMQAWDVKTVVADIAEEELTKAQEELSARRDQAKAEARELTEEETSDLPRFNPKTELMLSAAKEIKKSAAIGDVLEITLEIPHAFGRMAAQTAKQVIIQKIREAERTMVFDDFKGHEGEIIVGTVQRAETHKVLIDLGKITAIMPSDQSIPNERYRPGSRMKFFVLSVALTARGPEIILSRRNEGMVKEIFKQEIPEVNRGAIEIKGVARDAGFRSKVAVNTADESIDPIGSCIGQRGSRINTIIEELGGEKIDVIQYSDDPERYIMHALSPAKVGKVVLNESEKVATVTVPPEQFSLAIGRGGQNVRLAAELTGWKINVEQPEGAPVVPEDVATKGDEPAAAVAEETPDLKNATPIMTESVASAEESKKE